MRFFTDGHRQVVTRGLAAVAVLASVGVLAGCGGGGSGGSGGGGGTTAATSTPTTTAQAQTTQAQTTATATSKAPAGASQKASLSSGKKQFKTTCASCHTLADAGTHGTVGPNLDQLKPSKALVTKQVTNGGGGMPAFGQQLSKSQIASVATYVSKVAGKS